MPNCRRARGAARPRKPKARPRWAPKRKKAASTKLPDPAVLPRHDRLDQTLASVMQRPGRNAGPFACRRRLGGLGVAFDQRTTQFIERPTLDLPHPLLGDAEPVAERFQRGGIFGKTALA